MECWESNLDEPPAKQAPYLLYYLTSLNILKIFSRMSSMFYFTYTFSKKIHFYILKAVWVKYKNATIFENIWYHLAFTAILLLRTIYIQFKAPPTNTWHWLYRSSTKYTVPHIFFFNPSDEIFLNLLYWGVFKNDAYALLLLLSTNTLINRSFLL